MQLSLDFDPKYDLLATPTDDVPGISNNRVFAP